MDVKSSANDSLQVALNELHANTNVQNQQHNQQKQLNSPINCRAMSKSPLLEPVDLTHHCECIGEPLTPMQPQLTTEWIDSYKEYEVEGFNYEKFKEIRQSAWQSYLSHNDEDLKRLMINMYVIDYNQRLLDIHKNEHAKHELLKEKAAKELAQLQQGLQLTMAQDQSMCMLETPALKHVDMIYRCEDMEESLKANLNLHAEENKKDDVEILESASNVNQQNPCKRLASSPLLAPYEDIEEPYTPILNRYMEENKKLSIDFLERSSSYPLQNMNGQNSYFMVMPNMYNLVDQQKQQQQQQPQQQKTNNQTRRRMNRNRNSQYHNEISANNQQQPQSLQPHNYTPSSGYVSQPQASALPMFPNEYQADWRAWMEYVQRAPFYLQRTAFHESLEVNDYNQQILNVNLQYSYLQNAIDINTYQRNAYV